MQPNKQIAATEDQATQTLETTLQTQSLFLKKREFVTLSSIFNNLI